MYIRLQHNEPLHQIYVYLPFYRYHLQHVRTKTSSFSEFEDRE